VPPTIGRVDHRTIAAIEADIATIQKFASSYRAYWGVASDGRERQPPKDPVALRHRLHRQLPGVEKIMARAHTNAFGFTAPPIARGAPPRIGIVAVAFADEDPVYSVGGGPPCYEEVLNRLEMTLGVLNTELKDARSGVHSAPSPAVPSEARPVAKAEGAATVSKALGADEAPLGASPIRVFVDGLRKAWRDARSARREGGQGSVDRYVAITAGVTTIIGTLGAALDWWSP
jgi:hypothetical protein